MLTQALDWLRGHPTRFALAGVMAIATLYAVAALWLPFGWDHGILSSVGHAIARGEAPYLDAWDIKGPVAYLPFALAALLTDTGMWGLRVVDLLIVAPALYFIHRTVTALTGFMVGAGAALGLYFWIASHGFFFTAQPEAWAAALTSVAMCLLLRPQGATVPGLFTYFAIGALIACAGLIKPHFLGLGLAPLVYLALSRPPDWASGIKSAAALAAGAIAPITLAGFWLAAIGAVPAFIEAELVFSLTSYNGPDAWSTEAISLLARRVLWYFESGVIPIIAPFVVVGLWSRRLEPKILGLLLTWLVMAFLCVVVQGKLFVYHWFLVFPPLIISAALGVHAVLKDARDVVKVLVGVAVLLFANEVMRPPVSDVLRWVKLLAGGEARDYYGAYSFNDTYVASDIVEAGRYIRAHTEPEDDVQVLGMDTTVAMIAGRRSPTRFEYALPVYQEGPLLESYRAEMMRGLSGAPPAYIVIGSPWPAGDKQAALSQFPAFAAFLAERYALETTIGSLNLYHRVDGEDARRDGAQ